MDFLQMLSHLVDVLDRTIPGVSRDFRFVLLVVLVGVAAWISIVLLDRARRKNLIKLTYEIGTNRQHLRPHPVLAA